MLGSIVDEDTHCVLGFPRQRTLDGATSASYGIIDGASCFQTICARCAFCGGIDWNPVTKTCSACFLEEMGTVYPQEGYLTYPKVNNCSKDNECPTNTCDTVNERCFLECEEPPLSPTCQFHDLGSDDGLVIPDTPLIRMVFNTRTQSFDFDVSVLYTREQTSYVLGLDEFIDGRAINEVGLCENRNPDLFVYDNRAWWCSPADAYGIGSPDFLAWGPAMSWSQVAEGCYMVKFSRSFTLNQLSKTCSKPGSVIENVTPSYIQYTGTFHVTLAQEDSDWSLTSLVPLVKWNFPFEFSFTRDFKLVATLVTQKVTTTVKQGVSVFDGNRLAIFVDTRITDVYGPNAYVVLVSGMNSTNPIVIFPPSTPGNGLINGPEGTRTHNTSVKRALDDGTPCVFPGCQQVWNFLSLPIPQDRNFAGVYSTTFEVRGSVQSPNEGIDPFTLTITIDPTFTPEKVTEIDNINLGSKLTLYSDPQFTLPPSPSGYRQAEVIYVSQAIRIATEDKNLWELDLQRVIICLVTDGTFGCNSADETYVLVDNGALAPDTSGFAAVLYLPGSVPNDRFQSVVGISFKALPLATKKPASRVFFLEFDSFASLAGSQKKRRIQQNARVEDSVMLTILEEDLLNSPEEISEMKGWLTKPVIISIVIAAIGCALLAFLLILFVVLRRRDHKEKKEEKEIYSDDVELIPVADDENVREFKA